MDEIKENVKMQLMVIPNENFEYCCEKWKVCKISRSTLMGTKATLAKLFFFFSFLKNIKWLDALH